MEPGRGAPSGARSREAASAEAPSTKARPKAPSRRGRSDAPDTSCEFRRSLPRRLDLRLERSHATLKNGSGSGAPQLACSSMSTVVYDRRVSPRFLALFNPYAPQPGVVASLVTYANHALFPVDLRFRRDLKSGREHATLYVGLTAVLNVRSTKMNLLKLDAHPTHVKHGRFDLAWGTPMSTQDLAHVWPDVELYLDRVIPLATLSHGNKEGAVQAAVASHPAPARVVLDREVTPSFGSTAERAAFLATSQQPILDALSAVQLPFAGAPTKLGNECDALGIDQAGRLLAIEVKPLGVGSIAWVTAQATMYARLLQAWVDHPPHPDHDPRDVLRGMLSQRRQIGLAHGKFDLADPIKVVPVVALQRGASPEMIRRMLAVRDALARVDLGVPPVEIYEVNLLGEMLPLDESRHADGRPRARTDYAAAANRRQVQWKSRTAALPDAARQTGSVHNRAGEEVAVDYALPREYAEYNLLPEVRQEALAAFAHLKIAWHQGVGRGPTAHLRSSQVQCVNALGQMMADPGRIVHAFGKTLDIARVRDFGEIDTAEVGRYLTFEFIGGQDYFGEGRGRPRTRGSQSTSVDAAFAYTTSQGVDALALVEWKFTETYPSADGKAKAREAERLRRYASALTAPDSPIDLSGVDIPDLFHEPIYQLVRQQLLAHALETDQSVKADFVKVVHVLSPDNTAYTRSYVAPSLASLGTTPGDVWKKLLRAVDRFVQIDPAIFLDPVVASHDYRDRYGAS